MASVKYDLSEILSIPQWELVQDKLAELTGTAIITVDYKGIPITKHSGRTGFCSVIRENPVSRKRCFKCDALAGLEAIRLNRPFIYLCHCGIVDVAVPVSIDNRYLGAVMFGQVRLPKGDSAKKVERLVSEISSFQPDSEQSRTDLLELYEALPEMGYERIETIARFLETLVGYMVDQFLEINAQSCELEWLLSSLEQSSPEAGRLRRLGGAKGDGDDDFSPDKSTGAGEDLPRLRGSPIYPALMYMEKHMGEAIKLSEMANLCHLSASYFPRVFYRDVGENFKDYLNRRKIETAKERLRGSEIPISDISYNLGFVDPSYFTRMFRRLEGITPSAYRRWQKNK